MYIVTLYKVLWRVCVLVPKATGSKYMSSEIHYKRYTVLAMNVLWMLYGAIDCDLKVEI